MIPDGKPTVLIVDDTPDNVQLLSEVLGVDYRTKAATNGNRALKIAFSDDPPDLILLDVMMPDMDGFEVCRRLKENPITQRVPVIFVTAMNEVGDEQKGFAVGAVDYITKPISPASSKRGPPSLPTSTAPWSSGFPRASASSTGSAGSSGSSRLPSPT